MRTGTNTGPVVLSRTQLVSGLIIGLIAASIGALYTVYARWGMVRGMDVTDITFIRFATAGIVTLPILAVALHKDARAFLSQWRVWLAISLLAGPLFGLFMFTALKWAPQSHAAVFPFTTMSVMGLLMSAWFLGEAITLRKAVGIGIVLVGLIILSGLEAGSITRSSLIGDLLFIVAGILWAGFGIVMRKHRVKPLLGSAVISFFALATYVPIYIATVGLSPLLAVDSITLSVQILVQGVIAGAGALFFYAKMVEKLGASRSAIFPALAPGLAALMAWPILGHIPSGVETLGLVVSMLGLIIAVTSSSQARGAGVVPAAQSQG